MFKFIKKLLGKIEPDDFAEKMIETIRKVGDHRKIAYNKNEFCLAIGEEASFTFYLNNAYQEYLKIDKPYREQVLTNYAEMVKVQPIVVPDNFSEASPHLIPRIKTESYYGLVNLKFQLVEKTPTITPFKRLAEHLVVGLGYDHKHSITEISKTTLDNWQQDFHQCLDIARDNLWNISKGKFQQISPGLYLSPWQDNHDAARLFLYDLIWHLDVNGDHVAAIPNRDTLLITGSEDIEGLTNMAAIGEQLINDPRFISSIPVILKDKEWVSYLPNINTDIYNKFHRLKLLEEQRDYAEQKELLDKLLAANNEDIFVATYTVVQPHSKPDELFSYAVWASGVDTLLPRVDKIFFLDQDERKLMASWEDTFSHLADLMIESEYAPSRYRVKTFPTSLQLENFATEI